MNSQIKWKFSRINTADFSKFTIPHINSVITLYTGLGTFQAKVNYKNDNEYNYISLHYKKNGINTEDYMPLELMIQINDNSYATLVYSSVDYISNIIDISREWNTHTGKKNIEILEKGFDTIAPPGGD